MEYRHNCIMTTVVDEIYIMVRLTQAYELVWSLRRRWSIILKFVFEC